MLKALLLDMDETLTNTLGANAKAKQLLAEHLGERYGIDGEKFANDYVSGIYRQWNEEQTQRYLPVIETQGERAFRVQLIFDLLAEQGIQIMSHNQAEELQNKFDKDRLAAFDFFPGIPEFLAEAKKYFKLVVITNGPEYSQVPKVDRIKLRDMVDHVVIGGQEPEQKPAKSIFDKALRLAGCEAHEAIHIGDSLAADIKGAHNSGITSVWVQHQQPLDAELGLDPHHTVVHPSEVPDLIRELHPY